MHKFVFIGHCFATAISLIVIFKFIGNRSLSKWAVPFITLAVLAFELVNVSVSYPPTPFWDFLQAYYPAGHAVLERNTELLSALYEKTVQGFVNMPVVAYLFAPLSLFAPRAAGISYTLIGIAFTVVAWILLVRLARLNRRACWLLALLFLANGPLIAGLKFGNTSHIILFALVAGLFLLRVGRPAAAGALLGVAAILKPALLLFGIFFIIRRDVRGTVGFVATIATISALSLVLFGWNFNLLWFDTSILQLGHQWFGSFSVQSILGFILRLRVDPDILTSSRALIPTHNEKLAAQLSVALLYLVAAASWAKSLLRAPAASTIDIDSRRDRQYLLVICLAVVASPLSWTHYYCWLLMPTAFFLGSPQFCQESPVVRWLGWTAIMLVTPLIVGPWHLRNHVMAWLYQSFAVSYLLLGGLLWFGLIAWWLTKPLGIDARPTSALAVGAGRSEVEP